MQEKLQRIYTDWMGANKLIKGRGFFVLTLIAPIFFSGCMSHLHPQLTEMNGDPHIAYMDSKYRVCRGNCPQRTKKYLDDSGYIAMATPMTTQSQPTPDQNGVQQVAVSGKQNTPKKTETDVNAEGAGRVFEILFEFGKSKPTKEGQQTLQLLLEASSNSTSIELVGETDRIGTQIFNNKLAFARAHFVARWLKEHGVTTKISVKSKGECCLASPYDKTEKTLKNLRRVKVHVSTQPKKEGEK